MAPSAPPPGPGSWPLRFGEPRGGFGGDGGPATQAHLDSPSDIAALADGGFLIADAGNRVRRVLPDGTITTIAGNGQYGPGGDGGPAVGASLSVTAVDATPNGGFVVAGGDRVRAVTPDGRIDTIAGGGPEVSTWGGRRVLHRGGPERALLLLRELHHWCGERSVWWDPRVKRSPRNRGRGG